MNLKAFMRVITPLCAALYFFHSISASLFLLGYLTYSPMYKTAGRIMLALILLHALIVIIYGARNLNLRRTSVLKSRLYIRRNKSFYGQRMSGALLLIFATLHIGAYGYTDASGFHLRYFGIFSLVNQTALAFLAGMHILFSSSPLVISLGIDPAKRPGLVIVTGLRALIVISILVSVWAAFIYYLNFKGQMA